jgi:transcription elongation factor GreA
MSDKIPITVEGKKALEDELRHLKSVERPRVIEAIAVARAHGDLSENAEYSAAREKQGFIEGRIMEIGDKLARAEVIDPSQISSDRIVFGATVTVADDTGKNIIYQIVGETEGDLSKGKLSVKAPMARVLLGKHVGDEAVLKTPRGETSYEIVKIEYK